MLCSCFGGILGSNPRNGFKEIDVVPVSPCSSSSEEHFFQSHKSTNISKVAKEEVQLKSKVKETHIVILDEDFEGNKMINEYVRECKIGSGSYCKVVLYRSNKDGKFYAIKAFRKSRLCKVRATHFGNAMTKIKTEVAILKQSDHPNIVKLIEVIDDPECDQLYMVLEYMERGWIFSGSGPPGGIGEGLARSYFWDIAAGLKYLHNNNIVHGDIKPENLLVTSHGRVKICDFSESCILENNDDELQRSAGTPVFTAPECSEGSEYHGKAADIWALGITLYCMVLGKFPFIGETLRETFDKIVNEPLVVPDNINPDLADLLKCLLCKEPGKRISLDDATKHPWVVKGYRHFAREWTDL